MGCWQCCTEHLHDGPPSTRVQQPRVQRPSAVCTHTHTHMQLDLQLRRAGSGLDLQQPARLGRGRGNRALQFEQGRLERGGACFMVPFRRKTEQSLANPNQEVSWGCKAADRTCLNQRTASRWLCCGENADAQGRTNSPLSGAARRSRAAAQDGETATEQNVCRTVMGGSRSGALACTSLACASPAVTCTPQQSASARALSLHGRSALHQASARARW